MVHRHIRTLDQQVHLLTIIRKYGYADTEADNHFIAIQDNGILQFVDYLFCDFCGIRASQNIRQQQIELITANAGQCVTVSQAVMQMRGYSLQ